MKPDFTKNAERLLPAIIQDDQTNKVLMLGYMNEAAFNQTISGGKVVFYSRSKKRLWMKGETSGNFLSVKNILLDCDQDCLLIKASPAGAVCHTGADTCFNEKNRDGNFLSILEKIILDRKNNPSPNSYTSSLFQQGINKIAQKLGEEAVELIIEAKDDEDEKFKNEAADLLYHYLVLLQYKGYNLQDVVNVLEQRQ